MQLPNKFEFAAMAVALTLSFSGNQDPETLGGPLYIKGSAMANSVYPNRTHQKL